MAHQQGRSGRWRRCLPWRRWLRQRRCRPCRPSVPSPQRRLHAHTPAPCAGLLCVGAVTTGYAQTPTAPLAPRPRHSHTTDGSAQSAHDKPEAAQTQKAYSRQCGLPRQHKGCQHSADTWWALPAVNTLLTIDTCHTQPHAAVVRCFCPHCDAHPRNDPKGADVLAWERRANPVPVAQRGKACRIGVWLAAAARPKYRILTCCALDALSPCKCPLTPESRQRIAPLVQSGSTTDATQRPLTHSAIPRGREMPPGTAVPRHTHCPRE